MGSAGVSYHERCPLAWDDGSCRASITRAGRSTCQVLLKHSAAKTHAAFDDPNLVSQAGLVPVMRLAQSCGLHALAFEHVLIGRPCGANPHLKIPAIVAGMAAGADSIDDLDVLRHGAMSELFAG